MTEGSLDGGDLGRLNQAAAALLDPLIDPALADQPALQAQRLIEALDACARSAERVSVRGLSHLVTLSVPYLQQQAQRGDWKAARVGLETWVGAIVAFCAGYLPATALAPLVTGLQALPGFAPIPSQFVSLIQRRLARDAEWIAQLAGDGGTADAARSMPGPVPTDRDAGEPRFMLAPDRSTEPVPLARDEREMLVQALQALSAQTIELPAGGGPGDRVAERAWLGLHAEQLGQWSNAIGYLGLIGLSRLIASVLAGIDIWRQRPQTMSGPERERLSWLPGALVAFLQSPEPAVARRLCQGLADPVWPIALAPDQVELAVAAITHLRLIESRQIQALASPIQETDLSLAIPADAEHEVVEQWLRELPPLSAQLCESVQRLLQGDHDAWTQAQRIAHTLKGSANTVGIRGIATLAHQLEDLLALLDRRAVPLERADLILLEEGSDCLAEMCEAVVGQGAAPREAQTICQRLADAVAALLGAGAEDDGAAERNDEGTVPNNPAIVDDLPIRNRLAQQDARLPDQGRWAEPPADCTPPLAIAAPAGPLNAPGRTQDEPARMTAEVVDRLLELAAQASILLAQAREQLDQLQLTRGAFRAGSERLEDLADELARVVDLRSAAIAHHTTVRQRPGLAPEGSNGPDRAGDACEPREATPLFDALELDQYDDLHTVSRRIAESGADSKLLDGQLDRQAVALDDAISQLERVQADLRETVLHSRMVPVASIVPRLQRATRQAARMAQREVRLDIEGEATAVDAQLLQSLVDPLTHLLRNAVDHGIESAAVRAQVGKPALGLIRLSFEHTGRELRVVCRDDGAGLDETTVLARAIERGLIAPGAHPGPEQIARLVLMPGFSTRHRATQLSGRGIGLDVVQRAVTRLRGTLEMHSLPGQGMSVEFCLPIALAGLPVLVARTPTHVLALSIREVEQILPGGAVVIDAAGGARLAVDEDDWPVRRLDELLGLPSGWFEHDPRGSAPGVQARESVVLLVRLPQGGLIALITPELSPARRVVVRPMPGWLPALPGVEGACILGDGSAAPVIDLPQLLMSEVRHRPVPVPDNVLSVAAPPVCLVVDDSVSVRRSMETFLRDLGFEVDVAGDGREALARLYQRVPDLAIVDLEMPQMNGLALATALRADDRTAQLPIIMITSRASDKHRRLALDAGVDVFLTKPYTEDELATEIRRCLERRPPVG